MVNFIKISSLIIILLFFPTSFYFNIIPINCDSENNLHIEMSIDIYPDKNFTKWYVEIYNLFLENNSEPLVIEDIDWGELNRNGNIFYVNILIKNFRNREKNEVVFEEWNIYELGILKEGNYSFIVYVNDKLYETKNFIVRKPEEKPALQCDLAPWFIWNGEEWILRVKLISNMVPKGIHWDPLIRENKHGFIINVRIDEWIGNISEHFYKYDEKNYSLGILEGGNYSVYAYINGEFDSLSIVSISWTFTTYVPTTYTTTETCIIPEIISSNGKYFMIERTVTETRVETQKLITTTIKIKTTTTAITTEALTTKTIETKIKEKFNIEQYIIPLSLFIIVIMITILLYYILFKRREI